MIESNKTQEDRSKAIQEAGYKMMEEVNQRGMEYDVVSAVTAENIVLKVNMMIEKGWAVSGGISVFDDRACRFHQAMVRKRGGVR